MSTNEAFYYGPYDIRVPTTIKRIRSIDGMNDRVISDDFKSYYETEMVSPGLLKKEVYLEKFAEKGSDGNYWYKPNSEENRYMFSKNDYIDLN